MYNTAASLNVSLTVFPLSMAHLSLSPFVKLARKLSGLIMGATYHAERTPNIVNDHGIKAIRIFGQKRNENPRKRETRPGIELLTLDYVHAVLYPVSYRVTISYFSKKQYAQEMKAKRKRLIL